MRAVPVAAAPELLGGAGAGISGGPMACRLFSLTRHQYGNVVLPCEDRPSEQIFYAAWVHRISTAVQRGTALMIHNIAQGNRTKSRRTKDVDVEPAAAAATAPAEPRSVRSSGVVTGPVSAGTRPGHHLA